MLEGRAFLRAGFRPRLSPSPAAALSLNQSQSRSTISRHGAAPPPLLLLAMLSFAARFHGGFLDFGLCFDFLSTFSILTIEVLHKLYLTGRPMSCTEDKRAPHSFTHGQLDGRSGSQLMRTYPNTGRIGACDLKLTALPRNHALTKRWKS